jgi:uroporphyrin-III C-methyltransferase/precorrin-2 dehydrogenase/sirohydrochlorin ferrochelatase
MSDPDLEMNALPAWLPLQLRLEGRLAVLVGAGPVAQRKAGKLAQAGARLRIIAPAPLAGMDPDHPGTERIIRPYAGPGDLEGAFLVVAATGDAALNARIAADARGTGALALRADAPGESDVAFPATHRQGALTVSFATDGICPAFAARLKEAAASGYGPEQARRLETIRQAKLAPAFRALPAGERRARLQSWAAEDPEFRPGCVVMAGAGPGDPGLLTLKAVERLRAADVVVYDALANREILDRFAPAARHIDAGKHKGGCILTQDQINALLVELAGQGLRVLRLKGGDPCLFGRAGEEARALVQAGVPFEIVPGVSSLCAVPAAAGIPVTDRDFAHSLGAFSLHKRNGQPPAPEEWERMARGPETLVLFMGRSVVREACRQLVHHGRSLDLPAALIVNGTLPGQRTVTGTLATLPDRVEALDVQGPGLIVVGEVVRMAEMLKSVTLEAPCPA